jgi:hypothetical protein
VLKEEWDAFIGYIGGIQFIDDLRGSELDQYHAMTIDIKTKIARRRGLLDALHADISSQIAAVKRLV